MYAERHIVTVTTDALGAATAYSPVLTGRILQITYAKTDYAAGVDFTLTLEATGQTVWQETNVDAGKTIAPRQPTHDTAGVASLFAAGGEPVEDCITAVQDRIQIEIANGGNAKVGVFHIVIG